MERDDARGSVLIAVGLSIEIGRDPRERAGADALLGEVATVARLDQRASRRAISDVAGRNVGVDHRSQSILEQATAAAELLEDGVVALSFEFVEGPEGALIERIALRLQERGVRGVPMVEAVNGGNDVPETSEEFPHVVVQQRGNDAQVIRESPRIDLLEDG